ncbi:hypothetical protein L2E82_50357 [Cichorium intybus]|nr:hypothetical protein L2E82_50357 [Cichorium intybus]
MVGLGCPLIDFLCLSIFGQRSVSTNSGFFCLQGRSSHSLAESSVCRSIATERSRRFIGSRDGYRKTEIRFSFTPCPTMPPKSKSKRQKPKQQLRAKQQKPNWLDLPYDVTANILYRVGVFDIIENVQKVCTTWHKICKDPAMWRVIKLDIFSDCMGCYEIQRLSKIYKNVVDRSQGQLVDITIVDNQHAYDCLLEYVADRSSQLRRLEIRRGFSDTYRSWTEVLKKFPLLEELSLYKTEFSKEGIETAGRCCPLLTTLKLNIESCEYWGGHHDEWPCGRDSEWEYIDIDKEIAVAIGENLPGLRHLELIGNVNMSNNELRVILDGCRHLESIDLRLCSGVDLSGDFGEECLEKVKCLKLPTCPCSFDVGW